jgi:hypothetical protein
MFRDNGCNPQHHHHQKKKRVASSLATPPTTDVGEDAGEKGTLLHCWWECKLVQPLWKKIWRLLKAKH